MRRFWNYLFGPNRLYRVSRLDLRSIPALTLRGPIAVWNFPEAPEWSR